MRQKRGLSIASLFVVVSMLLTACGQETVTPTDTPITSTPTNTSSEGGNTPKVATATSASTIDTATNDVANLGAGGAGTLRYNQGTEPANLDPQAMSNVNEVAVGSLVFEALMKLNEKAEVVPAAAEKLEVSADGLKYTATLRDGLTYSDGTPLTAKNFEYAFHRLFDPRVPSRQYSSIAYDIVGADELDSTPLTDTAKLQENMDKLGVKALDDKRIEFTLKQKAVYFPYVLALWVGWPSRQDLVDAGGEEWPTDPNGKYYIGNGPFIMKEYKAPQSMHLEANTRYRQGTPKVKELRAVFITDSSVAFQSYRKGEIDFINVAAEDLDVAQSDPGLKTELQRGPGDSSAFIIFNTTRLPFDNLKVRQAFAQAVNRDDWVKVVNKGLGQVAYSMIPPGRPGYAEDIKLWEFNPEAAKRALAEAGYANGVGLPPIKLTYGATPRNKTRMEWLQNQIKVNLGLDTELDPVEPKTLSAMGKDLKTSPQVSFGGWVQDYPDPQNWLTITFNSSANIYHTGWKNAEYDRLTRAADQEPDQTKRLEMYHQAQEILVREAPVVFLTWGERVQLFKPYVKGMRDHVSAADWFLPGWPNVVNWGVEGH